jgi:hypothetical protein
MNLGETDSFFSTYCRGALVLTYAHWEGYFNESTDLLGSHLERNIISKERQAPCFRILFHRSQIDKLRQTEIKDDDLIHYYNTTEVSRGSISLDMRSAKSRSNLNYDRLEVIFLVYGLSWVPFQKERIFIQHQLVFAT